MVTDEEPSQTAKRLEEQEGHCQVVFSHRTQLDKKQVQKGEIGHDHLLPVLIVVLTARNLFDQAQRNAELHTDLSDCRQAMVIKGDFTGMQFAIGSETRKTMPWTRDQSEELWD